MEGEPLQGNALHGEIELIATVGFRAMNTLTLNGEIYTLSLMRRKGVTMKLKDSTSKPTF